MITDDDAFSSSFPAIPLKKYDVFISFRGSDTRENITRLVHRALTRENIRTYMDDNLEKGEDLWPALIKAIEESHMLLVVLSENYASSRWCLDELNKILECRERGHTVLPVFYKIEPSQVRWLKGSYGKAFAQHERHYKNKKEKLEKWKDSLKKIADLSGIVFTNTRSEDDLVQDIVKRFKTIKERVKNVCPNLEKLVGISENYRTIELSMGIGSKDVRVIGIWGMGGIGKTTIAEVAFVEHYSQFECCCFLAKVKETQRHELHNLRSKLFSELQGGEDHFVCTPLVNTSFAMTSSFKDKRVFIVLDDVDTSDQIYYLMGEFDWLGPGSCVIITSRDKDVLLRPQVNHIHEVMGLTFPESLQLFCMNAFGKNHPQIGYEEISESIVDYCKGNPLALTVLGRHFWSKRSSKRSLEIWKSELEKLRRYSNRSIHDVLKLSYDGLEYLEKKIFLDIACFFHGKSVDYVQGILDACKFLAASGLDSLEKKALITISYSNTIEMHDLIREMGKRIVDEESPGNPELQSRLWDTKKARDVLKSNKGTDKIEAIVLDMSQVEMNLLLRSDTFTRMSSLRLLIIYNQRDFNVYFPKDLESLPDSLMYIEWYRCPLKYLPSAFCPEKLVKISMRDSNLKNLWEGIQDLGNLERLDLTGSKNLIELPDFSMASKLEDVDLRSCTSLRLVHPSILSLHSLVTLLLGGCKSLESLEGSDHSRSLRNLDLWDCKSLKKFSVTAEKIEDLHLDEMEIVELPSSIGHFNKLRNLYITKCSQLKILPDELCGLKSLHRLHLSDCQQVDTSNLGIILKGLHSLYILTLRNCDNLSKIPPNIIHLSQLGKLDLSDCRRLEFVPELPPSVRDLVADNCISLKAVSINPSLASDSDNGFSIWLLNCMKLKEQSVNTMLNKMKEWKIDEIIYPGGEAPRWFSWQTKTPSITIDCGSTAHFCGAICCVIISHDSINAGDRDQFRIPCFVYIHHNTESDIKTRTFGRWRYVYSDPIIIVPERTIAARSDHVYIWYNDNLPKSVGGKVRFSFSVESGEKNFTVKGCGVQPVYNTDLDAGGLRIASSATGSSSSSVRYQEQMASREPWRPNSEQPEIMERLLNHWQSDESPNNSEASVESSVEPKSVLEEGWAMIRRYFYKCFSSHRRLLREKFRHVDIRKM